MKYLKTKLVKLISSHRFIDHFYGIVGNCSGSSPIADGIRVIWFVNG